MTCQHFFKHCLSYDGIRLQAVEQAVRHEDWEKAEKEFGIFLRNYLSPRLAFYKPLPLFVAPIALEGETWKDVADRILNQDIVSCYIRYQFEGEIDWDYNPTPDHFREWTWQFNRHNEFRYLAQADVKPYELAEDGGLIYNPLTEEGKINHTTQKYQNVSLTEGTLEIGNAKLHYAVPAEMTAYDSVPLRYSLECPDHQQVLHLSVTAFEEQHRRTEEPSFDLSLPGTVDVHYTYLGYIAGKVKEDVHPSLQADFSDQ